MSEAELKKKEEAPRPATTPVVAQPAGKVVAYDYGDDTGLGREGITQDDLAVPFLNVLQSNSPQVASAERRVKGAEIGAFYNTLTGECHDGKRGIFLVPAMTGHEFVEWVPRKDKAGNPVKRSGVGFRGRHLLESDVVQKAKKSAEEEKLPFGKFWTPEGMSLVETYYLYAVLVSDAEAATPLDCVVIPFTSTKIKAVRGALGSIFGVAGNPPLFAFLLNMTTWQDRNDQGEFMNVRVRPARGLPSESMLPKGHPAYLAARGLMLGLQKGERKVDYAQQGATASEGGPADSEGVF